MLRGHFFSLSGCKLLRGGLPSDEPDGRRRPAALTPDRARDARVARLRRAWIRIVGCAGGRGVALRGDDRRHHDDQYGDGAGADNECDDHGSGPAAPAPEAGSEAQEAPPRRAAATSCAGTGRAAADYGGTRCSRPSSATSERKREAADNHYGDANAKALATAFDAAGPALTADHAASE